MAIYRSVVTCTSPGITGTGTNTFHFRTTSDNSVNDDLLLQIATEALETMYGTITQLSGGGTTYAHDGVWLQIADPAPRLADVDGWSLNQPSSDPFAPPATAIVLSWRTALATRRGRGRTFISALRQASVQSNGTPLESARTAYLAAADALIGPFGEPGDGAFGVWSEADQVLRDFTGVTTANEFAVLRSRRD